MRLERMDGTDVTGQKLLEIAGNMVSLAENKVGINGNNSFH